MRNIKDLVRFISLSRTNHLNYLSSVKSFSSYTYKFNPASNNVKNCDINLQNNNMSLQKIASLTNIIISRNIAMSQVFFKVKKAAKKKEQKVDLREAEELLNMDSIINQMNKAIDDMKMDFVKNLTLRSTSGSVETISVKVDDKEYQIQELAQIARKPNTIVLNCVNFPTAIPSILKAIQKSGLNINPQQDGTTLFLPIPKVTKEHRENLAKNAKAIFIKHRDEIKDVKNKAVKSLKNHDNEDTARRVSAEVEKLCNKYVKEAEELLKTKQNELLGS